MSTMFAIKIKGEFVKVALRHNGGRMEVFNNLLCLVNKNRRVYPTDNTAQGIYTVGDVLKMKEKTKEL